MRARCYLHMDYTKSKSITCGRIDRISEEKSAEILVGSATATRWSDYPDFSP
jgi:hypothetical protein